MEKDPVCHMDVDTKNAQHKAEHKGKNYNFCCKECLDKFKKDPSQYIK